MSQQDLTVVGLTKDSTKLVLVSDTGEEFTLPVDHRLRSALRGEGTRIGQLEITMESTLRPRDIQARIRSGESPESVAAAAQTTLDRIMGYATPVLAERAHIAERAQRASVRRRSGEGPARLLGDAVAERLRARNVDPDSVEWDAWRREDGRWTLVAEFRATPDGTGRAEFVFDAPGRYVVPEDDEARRLVGEAVEQPAPGPASTGRRLSAVPGDEELPLGEDAIGMVSGEAAAEEEPTVDLTGSVRAMRESEGRSETGEPGWIATQASDRPERRPTARVEPEEAPAPEQPAEPEAEGVDDTAAGEDGEGGEQEPQAQQPSRRPVKKNKGRASVPSWDEIMFGGGRSD
ncbi:MAG: septation protein SepH [Nocardioidaceae bacterium]